MVAESGGIGWGRGLMGLYDSVSRLLSDSMGIQGSKALEQSKHTHSPQLWLETRATLKLASGDE